MIVFDFGVIAHNFITRLISQSFVIGITSKEGLFEKKKKKLLEEINNFTEISTIFRAVEVPVKGIVKEVDNNFIAFIFELTREIVENN